MVFVSSAPTTAPPTRAPSQSPVETEPPTFIFPTPVPSPSPSDATDNPTITATPTLDPTNSPAPTVTGAPRTATAQITLGSVVITLEAGNNFNPNDLAQVIATEVQAKFDASSQFQDAQVLVVPQANPQRSLSATDSRSLATLSITFLIYILVRLTELQQISESTGVSVDDLFADLVTQAQTATGATLDDTVTLEQILANDFGITAKINDVVAVTEPPNSAPPIPSPSPVVVSVAPS